MSEDKKNFKKLSNYAVIMILAAIIIIIIAAMADNREDQYENTINEKEQVNMNIQNEIVKLKDDNYSLGKEKEELEKKLEAANTQRDIYESLNKAWVLYSQEKKAEAEEVLKTLTPDTLTPEQNESYVMLQGLLQPTEEEKK